MEKLSVYVDHKQNVFITWIDLNTSGTMTISAEEAIEIGLVGKMAQARREVAEEEIEDDEEEQGYADDV